MDEHDHGGVGPREDVHAGGGVALHPAGPLDGGRCAGQRAEPVALVPLEDADGLHEQPGVAVTEHGAQVAQPGPGVDRLPADGERPLAADGGVGDAVGLAEEDRAVGSSGCSSHSSSGPSGVSRTGTVRRMSTVSTRTGRPPVGSGSARDRCARSWATRERTGTEPVDGVAPSGHAVAGCMRSGCRRGAAAGRDGHASPSRRTVSGPSAASCASATSASPTTTAVRAPGARWRRETSCTCVDGHRLQRLLVLGQPADREARRRPARTACSPARRGSPSTAPCCPARSGGRRRVRPR